MIYYAVVIRRARIIAVNSRLLGTKSQTKINHHKIKNVNLSFTRRGAIIILYTR